MQDMKYTNDNDVVKYTQMCHYIMLAYLGGLNRFWITIYEEFSLHLTYRSVLTIKR